MDNAGKAIYCNNCTYIRDGKKLYQVLGSITHDGFFLIKRAHNLNTALRSEAFTVICGCGYSVNINLPKSAHVYEQD